MPAWRFRYGLVLVCVLLVAGVLPAGSACAQSDAELKALNQRVIELHRAGKYREAIPLAERYAKAVKARHGPDHPDVANALSNLAQLLQDTNRLAEAEPLYRRALAIDEKSFGAEHPNVARDLNNLAQLLQATSQLAEAEPLMRRALAIDEKSLGAEALKINPSIGRSEALRRSMVELITGDRPQEGERASELHSRGFEPRPLKREMAKGKPQDAHPATWAPFVLVGERGR